MTNTVLIQAQGGSFFGSAIASLPYTNVDGVRMVRQALAEIGFREEHGSYFRGEKDREDTHISFQVLSDRSIRIGEPVIVVDSGHGDLDKKALDQLMERLNAFDMADYPVRA